MPGWLRTLLITAVVPAIVGVASGYAAVKTADVHRHYLRRDIDKAHKRIDYYHLLNETETAVADRGGK